MKRFIGMCSGQFGDLVINTVAIKWLKKLYPGCHFTLGISKKYSSIAPLFENNYLIDAIHIYEGYDDFPTKSDLDYLNSQNFDKVFNPMPKHFHGSFYNHVHYTVAYSLIQGLGYPDCLQCYLNPYFNKLDKYSNYVSISAFPSKSTQLDKTLLMDKWVEIVKFINNKGYEVLQLGGNFDLQIEGADKPDLTWVEASQALYSSKLQITCDTSWAWIGSAYQVPAIGLLGLNYPDMVNPFSHMPINSNAKYLWRPNIQDIPLEEIFGTIEDKLK